MQEVEHKGWTIQVQSSCSADGWRPRIQIGTRQHGSITTRPIVVPSNASYPTEAETDAEGLAMARYWINTYG